MFQTPTPNHIRVHLARFVSALPLITDFWPVSLSGGLDGPLLLSRHIWNRIAISQHDITTGWLLYHQILIEAIRNRMHSHRVQFDSNQSIQLPVDAPDWFSHLLLNLLSLLNSAEFWIVLLKLELIYKLNQASSNNQQSR